MWLIIVFLVGQFLSLFVSQVFLCYIFLGYHNAYVTSLFVLLLCQTTWIIRPASFFSRRCKQPPWDKKHRLRQNVTKYHSFDYFNFQKESPHKQKRRFTSYRIIIRGLMYPFKKFLLLTESGGAGGGVQHLRSAWEKSHFCFSRLPLREGAEKEKRKK